MKKLMLLIGIVVLSLMLSDPSWAQSFGTAFIYQGRLSDGGSSANAKYDFEFKLFNALEGGDQYGVTLIKEDVSVYEGYFTVALDFVDDPNVFNGEARWLNFGVRPGGSGGGYITLIPRQEVTPAPYALYSDKARSVGSSGDVIVTSETGAVEIGEIGKEGILHLFVKEMRLYDPDAREGYAEFTPLILMAPRMARQQKNDWDFGDGGTNTTTMTPTHEYCSPINLLPSSSQVNIGLPDRPTELHSFAASFVYGADVIAAPLPRSGYPDKLIKTASYTDYGLIMTGTDQDLILDPNSGRVGIGTTNPQGLLQVGEGTFLVTDQNWVGINDLDPDAKLEVSVDGEGTPDLFMLSSDDDQDGDRFIVKNNGNVGIGTTSPTETLDIDGTARIRDLPAGTESDDIVVADGQGVLHTVAQSSVGGADSDWAAVGGGPPTLAGDIYHTGDVGIGTTSPVTKLTVSGDLTMALGDIIWQEASSKMFSLHYDGSGSAPYNMLHIRHEDSGGQGVGNIMTFTQDRKVGIGDSFHAYYNPPMQKLDVDGWVRVRELPDDLGTDCNAVVVADGDGVLHTRDITTLGGADDDWAWSSGSGLTGDIYHTGMVGIGTASPEFKLSVDDDGGIIAKGTYGSGVDLITSGAGTRLIWYPKKAAFRAGRVSSTQWDDASIGDYSVATGLQNTASGTYSVAMGYNNTATVESATVGGGQNNNATGVRSTIGGGLSNEASYVYATVSGGYNNEASGGEGSTVGGGRDNQATSGYATIAGGYNNEATNSNATVSGGDENTASGLRSTIGGGMSNEASGSYATIGGGYENAAHAFATVGGGYRNTATGDQATVAGGVNNSASGSVATVPGGSSNTAAGAYSFAAGRRAKANNQGSFVWGDSTDADLTCSTDNRWVARCSGGVYFYTSSDLSTGVYLAAGSESWQQVSASDRNLKDNFAPVNGQDVLARLAEVPISTWNYRAGSSGARHMSPMAQDFHNAFGLGEDDRHLSALDTNGVALAAIQALYQLNQEKDAEIAALKKHNEKIEARLAAVEAIISKLDQNK